MNAERGTLRDVLSELELVIKLAGNEAVLKRFSEWKKKNVRVFAKKLLVATEELDTTNRDHVDAVGRDCIARAISKFTVINVGVDERGEMRTYSLSILDERFQQ